MKKPQRPGRRSTDIPIKALEVFKEEISTHIEGVIVKTVNGKIESFREEVTKRLDAQDAEMQPMVEAYRNMNWSWKAFLKLLGFLSAVGALYLMGIKIFKR